MGMSENERCMLKWGREGVAKQACGEETLFCYGYRTKKEKRKRKKKNRSATNAERELCHVPSSFFPVC